MEQGDRFICHLEAEFGETPEFCVGDVCCGIYKRQSDQPTFVLWIVLVILILIPILYYIYESKVISGNGENQVDCDTESENSAEPTAKTNKRQQNNQRHEDQGTLNNNRNTENKTDKPNKDKIDPHEIVSNSKSESKSPMKRANEKNQPLPNNETELQTKRNHLVNEDMIKEKNGVDDIEKEDTTIEDKASSSKKAPSNKAQRENQNGKDTDDFQKEIHDKTKSEHDSYLYDESPLQKRRQYTTKSSQTDESTVNSESKEVQVVIGEEDSMTIENGNRGVDVHKNKAYSDEIQREHPMRGSLDLLKKVHHDDNLKDEKPQSNRNEGNNRKTKQDLIREIDNKGKRDSSKEKRTSEKNNIYIKGTEKRESKGAYRLPKNEK